MGQTINRALPTAILGNGSLLATFSARGRVERLCWPHPDRDQLLDRFRLGVAVDGVTHWLDEEPFACEQSYLTAAMVLRTNVRGRGLEVEIEDLVDPIEPALIRRVRCFERSARLVVDFRGSERLAIAATDEEVVCAAGYS